MVLSQIFGIQEKNLLKQILVRFLKEKVLSQENFELVSILENDYKDTYRILSWLFKLPQFQRETPQTSHVNGLFYFKYPALFAALTPLHIPNTKTKFWFILQSQQTDQ